MAAYAEERWLNELPKHAVFKLIRDKLDLESGANEKGITKNLTFCLGADFFVWDDEDRVFYTTNLRQLNSDEGADSGKFQTLLCINPPLFEVWQVLLSPSQHHVALVGHRGVSVLELPQRWGKRSEFEGGRAAINCRTTPVAERFFTSSPAVSLRQAAWFPSETAEPHLVLLTSDNTLRLYGLKAPQTPARTLPVSQAEEEGGVPPPGRGYAASLGETAVAFDFGPLSPPPASFGKKEELLYPLYILYENGETYVSYAGLNSGPRLTRPAGPLAMHPAAEDNYGYDACAILCLPCVPSILVIATETGTLYHCVVLESEEEEDGEDDDNDNGGALVQTPGLYVFECVELELRLKVAAGGGRGGEEEGEEPMDAVFPVRLHRDPLCSHRFHCTHSAGVHSVGLPWLGRLQRFLTEEEEEGGVASGGGAGLSELAAGGQRCVVEHLVCTRPLTATPPPPPRGFLVLSDLGLGACMLVLTASCECLVLPLLTSIRPPSPPLLCSQPGSKMAASSPLRGLAQNQNQNQDQDQAFQQHVRNLLARGATNPLILKAGDPDKSGSGLGLGLGSGSPPPPERLQLLSRATQVFREEYVLRQDLARDEVQRRARLLAAQRQRQREEAGLCQEERRGLREAAERLADKYEDARYRQEALALRVRRVLLGLRAGLPQLSGSEKQLRRELEAIGQQLTALDTCIKQVQMKTQYQRAQVGRGGAVGGRGGAVGGRGGAVGGRGGAGVALSAQQQRVVQDVLREQGTQIGELMRRNSPELAL
ncbi:LOW QUALITY PROTEIN: nucleoporin 88 [Menidia menidia]